MGRRVFYQGVCVERLRRAHADVARLVLDQPAALPIFERLDHELRAAEAMIGNDPIAAARAMLSASKGEFRR